MKSFLLKGLPRSFAAALSGRTVTMVQTLNDALDWGFDVATFAATIMSLFLFRELVDIRPPVYNVPTEPGAQQVDRLLDGSEL